jgi:hypothetical protein
LNHQREHYHFRGSSNGGLFHRQRDTTGQRLPTAEAAVAALRPSSAPHQQPRRDGMDQWRRNRVDQWQRRIGEPGGRGGDGGGGGSQEEKLFLNGWSSQFLSSQDISLHVVSQV